MEIQRQSDYYGFVDPRLAEVAEVRVEAVAPSEIADLLHGPRITPGMHSAAAQELPDFDPGPSLRRRAAYGDVYVYLHDDSGNTLAVTSDPDADMRFAFGRTTDAKAFIQQHLGGTGWFYDENTGEMAQARVSDFSYNDGQADRTDEMRQLLGHRVTAASLPADPAAAIEQIADELGWSRQDPRALEFDDWIGDRFYNEGLEPTSADIGEIAAKARDLGWTPTDEQWLPTPGAQRLYDEFAGQGRLRTLLEVAARYERDEVQGDPMRAAIILDRNGVDARKVNFMVS